MNIYYGNHCDILAGKSLNDSQTLAELNVDKTRKIYFKDLGQQIGWSTVKSFKSLIYRMKS